MKKKNVLIGIGLITSILLIYIVTLSYDYKLALQEIEPKFSYKTATNKDGGTTTYIGFGYIIKDYNEMEGRDYIQISSLLFSDSLKEKSFSNR